MLTDSWLAIIVSFVSFLRISHTFINLLHIHHHSHHHLKTITSTSAIAIIISSIIDATITIASSFVIR